MSLCWLIHSVFQQDSVDSFIHTIFLNKSLKFTVKGFVFWFKQLHP